MKSTSGMTMSRGETQKLKKKREEDETRSARGLEEKGKARETHEYVFRTVALTETTISLSPS